MTIKDFITEHTTKKSTALLCKNHHQQLDKTKVNKRLFGKFMRNINF
jgi:hypothetical protein